MRSFLTAVGIFVLLAGATGVIAQTDPTKALVGTCEVWVEGRYGFTIEKMGRSPNDISLQGNDLMLEFVSGEKSPI